MKSFWTVIFLCICTIGISQTKAIQNSPPLAEASPESVGMSKERISRIDKMCEMAIEQKEVPGIVALVARNGKIVFYKGYGQADNQAGRAIRRDDIFRIASQTKAITATAVMMLWEEGKFQLDDPIARYIPAFENAQILDTLFEDGTYRTKPAKTPVTIRHLITHTSGIGYGEIDSDERFKKIYNKAGITDLFTTKEITIGESVRKLAKLPLHHEPGTEFTYSEGLDVLGYFIEVISGVPFDQFLRTHVFDPLGMNDTWFYLPDSKYSRLVAIQERKGDQWVRYPVTFYDPDYPIKGAKAFFSGGAGLCSTARDYATFLQMYLNKGELNGIRLLSRTTVQFMMENQIGALGSYGLAFGLLNEESARKGGSGSEGTFDWGGYFNTQYFADPKENVIGIIMKQTRGNSKDETGWKFRQLVGQAIDN